MTSALHSGTISPWLTERSCNLDDFIAVTQEETVLRDYPHAQSVEQNVLIYGPDVAEAILDSDARAQIQSELIFALQDGPGIVVFSGAFPDDAVVNRATEVFKQTIAEQNAAGTAVGDHFGKPGANDRVWGALDKFAVRAPEAFADYYANDVLALVAEAWLGPNYQVTSQVNVVNPGGEAQRAHRDYHLGFMSSEQAVRYPSHVHRLSPSLTLQGAVAHCDMPVESGPTLYLPHSQKYKAGYLAFHRPEFTSYFEQNFIQLPLRQGDAVFFNPALFHGAGQNRSTSIRRTANLLQVSSAFGRAMEEVDRTAMAVSLYPTLQKRLAAGDSHRSLRNIIASSAEGYGFPTNLDRDAPVGGIAPESQAEFIWRALQEGLTSDQVSQQLVAIQHRRSVSRK